MRSSDNFLDKLKEASSEGFTVVVRLTMHTRVRTNGSCESVLVVMFYVKRQSGDGLQVHVV